MPSGRRVGALIADHRRGELPVTAAREIGGRRLLGRVGRHPVVLLRAPLQPARRAREGLDQIRRVDHHQAERTRRPALVVAHAGRISPHHPHQEAGALIDAHLGLEQRVLGLVHALGQLPLLPVNLRAQIASSALPAVTSSRGLSRATRIDDFIVRRAPRVLCSIQSFRGAGWNHRRASRARTRCRA